MSIGTLHAVTDYQAKLKQWLMLFEQPEPLPYYDSAATAQVTIGIGFNNSDAGVRNNVYDAMNVSTALRAQLTAIINDPAIRQLPPGNDPGERNYELRRQLDSAYGQPFVMTAAEMDVVYTQEIASRETVVTAAIGPSLERLRNVPSLHQ